MARIKGAVTTRKRRKKIIKLAKGNWGAKSKLFKTAKQAVMKSLAYSYVGRKTRKRDFRSLWISRISAAVKQFNINYSSFIKKLKDMSININRKLLSEMAINDNKSFNELIMMVKKSTI